MVTKPIRRVTVEFADGTVQTWDIPSIDQGFYRERYSWSERHSNGVGQNYLHFYELMWSLKEPLPESRRLSLTPKEPDEPNPKPPRDYSQEVRFIY